MKFLISLCLILIPSIPLVATPAAAAEPDANRQLTERLMRESDRARGGVKDGLTWTTKVTSVEDGEETIREFTVKAKGDNAFVEAIAPARSKGEVYIFNDRNMWFFKPSLKKPVSISPRQKLTGQASNGDIASTQYARDYSASLERTDTVNNQKAHVLLLKAKAPNLTYDQIRYWVEDKRGLAIKAEFLTLQGQVFKVAEMEYGNQITLGGQKLPFVSKLKISDSKFQQNKSTIEYTSPRAEDHPNSIFNVNNLSR
jgi:putative ABC transport system permease protein